MHGPVLGEQVGVDPEQGVLERGVVGDDAAAEDRGGSGHGDQGGEQRAARERLGDGEGAVRLREAGDEAGSGIHRIGRSGDAHRRLSAPCGSGATPARGSRCR